METTTIMAWVVALLAVSEALSLIPGIKANGIFQVIWNILKVMAGKKPQ